MRRFFSRFRHLRKKLLFFLSNKSVEVIEILLIIIGQIHIGRIVAIYSSKLPLCLFNHFFDVAFSSLVTANHFFSHFIGFFCNFACVCRQFRRSCVALFLSLSLGFYIYAFDINFSCKIMKCQNKRLWHFFVNKSYSVKNIANLFKEE